jgi:hypothetical protein
MRKTLFAMLGLAAIGVWALPALAAPIAGGQQAADGPAKVSEPVPLDGRAGAIGAMARNTPFTGTLSGTLIKQSTVATTTYFMYPGACVERALGTWAAKANPVADSLQPTTGFPNSSGYASGQPTPSVNNIAYTRADQSLAEILWHVANTSDPSTERPPIIDGDHMLWCGKFDANWVNKVGYPNLTNQILYIYTGTHAGNYHLTFSGQGSSEQNYDYCYFIGGGGAGQPDQADPLGNRRDYLDDVKDNGTGGPYGDSDLIVAFTGTIDSPSLATQTQGAGTIIGSNGNHGYNDVPTLSYDLTIEPDHQGIYVYFTADCLFSSEDGLWAEGHSWMIDLVATSDNGMIYDDQTPVGGMDAYSGNVILGTPGTPIVSARVPAGVGELWQLADGTQNPTNDACAPQKKLVTDLFFEGGDPVNNVGINKQFNSVVGCSFPVPTGTASVFAIWGEYLDLPRFAGYVQYAEFRYYKCEGLNCGWSNWDNVSPGGGVHTGALQTWITDGEELAEAVQADSVQVRYNLQCIAPFAADRQNCSSSQINPLLYDDFRLQVTTGVPAPIFGIFPGSVVASTFVDGTIHGTNCSTTPCWPGNRGTDINGAGNRNLHGISIYDNFNSATGDSITLSIVTGLRKNGMGVNWHYGTDKGVNTGEPNYAMTWPASMAHTNGSYNPAYDVPRMIYRLFDPATKTWSPFDSTELVPNVAISDPDGGGPTPPDTVVIDSEYSMDWPPFDKIGQNLPGAPGWSLNGNTTYNQITFMPKGTRLQYYFKGVDINGGVSYQFTTDNNAYEVEDLPTLPGGSIVAPDILEADILPRVYPPGPAGSLLAGKTSSPILNLDGVYSTWSYQQDPMTQALRGLGVRADRWRDQASVTTANHFGGHELPGKRPDRLSNFFPNYLEYPIIDSLATWYKVLIQSGHTRTISVFNEQDATLAEQWWRKDTGTNQGDRGIFISGDDVFNTLLNTTGVDITLQISLAQNVFGVNSAINAWTGTTLPGGAYPTIDDRFAAPTAGPGLAAAGTYTYPVDGGCPGVNKFDGLVKSGNADAVAVAFYPSGTEVAGIAMMTEKDNITDKDRNKALAYGYSIQMIRQPGIPTTASNYVRSGVENRMRVMYKFITGIRGVRTSAPGDTGKCWPCPTDPNMTGEWATLTGFNTGMYGPLIAAQAHGLATGVPVDEASDAPRFSNTIAGNYPNPFNPQTTIKFSSAKAGKATIRIFNVSGRLVRTMTTNVTAGTNYAHWNGRQGDGAPVSSGVYFFKVSFPDGTDLKSPNNLVLVK